MSTAPQEIPFEEARASLAAEVNQGVALKHVFGLTERELAAMYAHGYNLYNQAKYAEAAKAFAFLVQHDHLERKYYKALGSCLQMLRRHEDALKYYAMATTMDMMDPEPSFHAGECLLALGRLDEAKNAFDACVDQCAALPTHRAMGERAKALLAILAQPRAA